MRADDRRKRRKLQERARPNPKTEVQGRAPRRAARDAAKLDAAVGNNPFLAVFHRERARRDATKLIVAWDTYDDVLAQPALRVTLERKYGVGGCDEGCAGGAC